MLPFLFNLVCLFRKELYSHKSYFILRIVAAKLVHSVVYIVGLRLTEVFVDVVHLVFVHHVLKEVIDVYLSARIDNSVYLVEQILEIEV